MNKNNKIIDEYKVRYLKNLQAQIEIDSKYALAKRIYKETGEASKVLDARTLEEKLKDIMTIRTEVRVYLNEITDSQNSSKIVYQLSDSELQFYNQQYKYINKIIRERYDKGIESDIFISYLRKYIIESISNQNVTSGLIVNSSVSKSLSNIQSIFQNVAQAEDYKQLKDAYNGTIDITEYLVDILTAVPDKNLYYEIDNVRNQITKFQLLKNVNSYIKDLPTKGDINRYINEVKFLVEDNSLLSLEELTKQKIIPLITVSYDTVLQKQQIIDILDKEDESEKKTKSEDEVPESEIIESETLEEIPIVKGKLEKDKSTISYILPLINNLEELIQLKKEDILTVLDYIHANVLIYGAKKILEISKTKLSANSADLIRERLRNLNKSDKSLFNTYIIAAKMRNQNSQLLMKGKGIRKMKGKGIHHDIEDDVYVDRKKRYLKFGRYIINQHKLENDNKVYVVRPCKSKIKTIETNKVITDNVKICIKNIIGNGILGDIENDFTLSQKEKDYINDLSKQSQINRLFIESPKISKHEYENNQFMIMKGEIFSGNDNFKLVNEFKQLIVKLAKENRLDNSKVQDLIIELQQMGY